MNSKTDFRQLKEAKLNFIALYGTEAYLDKFLIYLKKQGKLTSKEVFEQYYQVRKEILQQNVS